MRPLDNVTVVSIEHAVSAPFCTRQLADMGARVIKIERPGTGDFARDYDSRARGLSSYFAWCNRSKESFTLDVKHPDAAEILAKLLGIADVFVQNLAPGAAARLGLSYDALREKNSKLIVCDISGYGADGPYRDKKAYDLLIQGEAGVLSVTGTPEHPSKVGCAIADIAAGMYAYTNILGALIGRGRSGQGCRIDVSMFESMLEWMTYGIYYAIDNNDPPARAGASHPAIYPYGPFTTGDGKTVLVGLQNEREWAAFCDKVLGRPELAKEARFSNNTKRAAARSEIDAIVNKVFSTMTIEEVIAKLDAAPIGNARMNDMHDVWSHEQLKARKRWVEIDTPVGTIPALLPPGTPAYSPRMGAIPKVGQHTDSILRELGYPEGELARLRQEQAI